MLIPPELEEVCFQYGLQRDWDILHNPVFITLGAMSVTFRKDGKVVVTWVCGDTFMHDISHMPITPNELSAKIFQAQMESGVKTA